MTAVPSGAPRYSVSQFSTPHNSFEEDLAQLSRTGAGGIGLWESRLPQDDHASLVAMRQAGLQSSLCIPSVWSFLPSRLSPEPKDPEQRLEVLCNGLKRLAHLDAEVVCVTPGGAADYPPEESVETITRGLAKVAAVARLCGVTVGFEPIRAASGSPVSTLEHAVSIIDQVGAANIGVVFDIWHLWDLPTIHQQIQVTAARIVAVQVNDWRDPTRSWADRVLPGDGVAGVAQILASFRRAGYHGWYDLEIISDDGTRGTRYEDSLWLAPHEEMLKRAHDSFMRTWNEAGSSRVG